MTVPPGEKKSTNTSVRDIRIVAALFLLQGAGAVVDFIRTRRLELTPGVLGIPIGIGLLRYRNGWRIAALVSLWITTAVCVVLGVFAMLTGQRLIDFGKVEASPRLLGALTAVVGFAYFYWQIRVLTRPNVRRSFELEGAEPP